jgi:N utilization substance protein B
MQENISRSYSPRARARARRTAVQACYQWLITSQSMSGIITEFEIDNPELKKADRDYFRELLQGIARHAEELDERLMPFLDRPLAEISPVESAILKLGMYELVFREDLPWRVIMNETIELAKMFGADQSYKFVNGVLDKAARQIRVAEVTGNRS